jgi:putative effector of murein hydrolase
MASSENQGISKILILKEVCISPSFIVNQTPNKTYTFVTSFIAFTIRPCGVQVSIGVRDSVDQIQSEVVEQSIKASIIIGTMLKTTSAVLRWHSSKQVE